MRYYSLKFERRTTQPEHTCIYQVYVQREKRTDTSAAGYDGLGGRLHTISQNLGFRATYCVINGHSCSDTPTRTIDIETDRFLWIFGLQEQ